MIDTKNLSFRKQPLMRYCGQCQAATILEYCGIAKKKFKDCSLTKLSRITGLTSPSTFMALKSKYHMDLFGGNLKNTADKQKIDFIKNRIDNKKPTIVLLGHGYKLKKNKIQHGKRARMIMMQHWVSIWGYDDSTQEFLIYDSSIGQKGEGIINLKLNYNAFLKYWKWGAFGLMPYQFVSIK